MTEKIMREFDDMVRRKIFSQGNFSGVEEARDLLDDLLRIYTRKGVKPLLNRLSQMDISDETTYNVAITAFRLAGFEADPPWSPGIDRVKSFKFCCRNVVEVI